MPMFVTALFIVAERKQLKCSLKDAWRMKIWHMLTMEAFRHKREKNSAQEKFEDILPNETSITKNISIVLLHLYDISTVVKFIEMESRKVIARGWWKENNKLLFNGH